MTFKKRGLGRGLEALLADDSAKEEKHQPQTTQSSDYQPAKDVGLDEPQAMPVVIVDCMDAGAAQRCAEEVDGQTAMVVALFKNIQRENLILLEEAETLRRLIEEFESIVRADPS